ncbi:MAG TPA: AbiEi antitoxin N-terminal domain-containing protein [Solirubrobacterales bacterium]|nr:AbiEi antitoxin N-terminal domain-containing protein [Solirubrobacterales bacterium]
MAEKRRPEGRHKTLAGLAKRQHGVVSARQLRQLGYSYDVMADAARSGRLHRLHRGVYAVGYQPLTWHGRCLAAVLARAPAFASHASAGWIWGLLRYPPGTIDLTAPTKRHGIGPARLHFAPLDARDRTEREVIPVTSLARTQLDLAATLPPGRIERVLERSEELQLLDLSSLEELLSRVTHHRGVRPLREALAIHRPDPTFTRSGLERRFLALVKTAGLPVPAMNRNVAGFELDAYWEAERFAVELDVFETHGTRAAFERDRLRQEDLLLAGIAVDRVTGPRLEREPQQVIERLQRLLAQRRALLRRPAGAGR